MADSNYNNGPSYSINGFEKFLNWLIQTIFFYRMLIVLVLLSAVTIVSWNVSSVSAEGDKLKNISLVFAAGSVIIGIFYSIINYEHTYLKYKNDQRFSKSTLSFTTACDWHKPTMVDNLKTTNLIYEEHKHLIDENKASEFYKILQANEEGRMALVSILNFFECLAVGINSGILDESFMKSYFKGVVMLYCNNYGFYISYRRNVNNSPELWINFTDLHQKWIKNS